jgi:hypothetical protein
MTSLDDRVANLEDICERLDPLITKLEDLDVVKVHEEFEDGMDIVHQLDTLVRGDTKTGELGIVMIVNGSEEFGVEPIRVTLRRISKTYDRLAWLAGILGISTVGSLIAWILFLLGSKGVP